VQGYVYAAKRAAAALAALLGRSARAEALAKQAQTLREHFELAFWCEDLATYALALDGHKRPCRVRTSNAGHCLFTGIAGRQQAAQLARTLLAEDAFSGWGIRTLAAGEVRYNPMSYHNGSVWPHDNALIAAGLARYGFREQVVTLLDSLFDASLAIDLHRMPELFCGFPRRSGERLTPYPVACAPQAWAAGAVYLLLQACLGLSISGPWAEVRFVHPVLPAALAEVEVKNLVVGSGVVDLVFYRHERGVSINVARKEGEVEVVVVK
jgi:glycogen debranching enzyme